MAEQVKRVCVLGAGASGLPAMKICLEEGFEVVCLERSEDIGGLWRFTTNVDGKACCMKSTVINTSKEMQAYSDFPPAKHMANYMHNSVLMEYLRTYADKFKLTPHIRFGCEVSQVEPVSSATFTKWRVTYSQRVQVQGEKDEARVESTRRTEQFDAVLVCTGHHSTPYVPEFQGLADFGGQVMHSHAVREHLCGERFAGKRVVVIGIGNSGLDAANEVSQVAARTYLVSRRGAWILSRYTSGGVPTDFVLASRALNAVGELLGVRAMNFVMRRSIEAQFDHSLFGLRPDTEPMSDHPYVSDGLLNALQTGRIELVRSGIRRFASPRSVEFTNGLRVDDVDLVLMCTGYRIQVPFLPETVFRVVENRLPLYKRCVHPDFQTLVFVGYIQPFGPILPISEMQARVAAALWRRDLVLPARAEIDREINDYNEWMRKRFVTSLRHTVEVDFVAYMDDLATLIGVKPNVMKLLVTDFALFRKVMFEGCSPYQFRLTGRHAWPGARDAIMAQRERMEFACAPLVKQHQTKAVAAPCCASATRIFFIALVAVLVALMLNCCVCH